MVTWKKLPRARSELDWRVAKAQATLASQKQCAGFIFVCSNSTVPDLDRQLFGLPARHAETVKAIRKGIPLFLYNYSTRLLHGVFEAATDGGFNLDPHAWEDFDMKKIGGPPISRYPAQVKIHVRAMRPPLDEDTFCQVLDYEEGQKFRLELTQTQVQVLLELFGLSAVAYSEFGELNEGNMKKLCHKRNLAKKLGFPDFLCKSDSDTCSASDDGGNFCEDEWPDEIHLGHLNDVKSLSGTASLDYDEAVLEQKARELTVEDQSSKEKMSFDKNDSKQRAACSYSSALVNGMLNRYEECKSGKVVDCKFFTTPSKGNSPAGLPRAQTVPHMLNDIPILLRLHETDPAVNSNPVNHVRTNSPYIRNPKEQKAMSRSNLYPPQVGENVLFIPFPAVNYQQTVSQNFGLCSQRMRWNEPRKSLRNLSGQNSRKKPFNQDKPYRQNHKPDYQKQKFPSEHWQHSSVQSPGFQLGQVLLPVCVQGRAEIQEQGHSPSASLPSPLPLHPGHSREQCEMHGSFDDDPLQSNELQDLLRNGQCGLQDPLLLMPSMMQRLPGRSLPMTEVNIEALHYEILEFAKMARPSPKTRLHAETAIKCVQSAVRRVWPEADVEVFGSFATGLCLRHSDVDLAVVDAPFPSSADTLSVAQASALLLRELARVLHDYPWCESINVLDTASMPVLKSRCKLVNPDLPATVSYVAIDITIGGMRNLDSTENKSQLGLKLKSEFSRIGNFRNKHTGGVAREYVLQKMQDLPALAPLVLLLKSYLYHRRLSDVYSGGLGSFSLTLLLAFYLEKVPLPCELFLDAVLSDSLPSPTSSSPSSSQEFSEDSDTASSNSTTGNLDHDMEMRGEYVVRRAANVVDRVLTLWHSGEFPYLGTLLLGFLQTFGFELDLSSVKIVLKGADGSPGGIFQRDSTTRHIALWIDDPLRPGINVGAGSYAMCQVQVAFQEMLQVLTSQLHFISLPQNTENILDDIPGITSLHRLSRLFDVGEDSLRNQR